jgi:hypothetical protein
MSLILDALNKAQRERQEQRQPVPQLSTVHYTPAAFEASPKRSKRLPWMALGIMAAGTLLLVILKVMAPVVEAPAREDSPAAKPSTQVQLPVIGEGHTPGNVRGLESEASVAASGKTLNQRRPALPRTQVNDLYRTAPDPVADIPRQVPGRQGLAAPVKEDSFKKSPVVQTPTIPDEQTALSTTAPTDPATQPSVEQTDPRKRQIGRATADPVPVPESAPKASLDNRVDIPAVDELSWSTQQLLPSILYSVHHYEADPANRWVNINSTTFRAGATIVEGLVLEEILSDGIVLRYRSQPFKLPALNSWVNF